MAPMYEGHNSRARRHLDVVVPRGLLNPAAPSLGQLFWNDALGSLVCWNGSSWDEIGAGGSGITTPSGPAGGVLSGEYPDPDLDSSVAGEGLNFDANVISLSPDATTVGPPGPQGDPGQDGADGAKGEKGDQGEYADPVTDADVAEDAGIQKSKLGDLMISNDDIDPNASIHPSKLDWTDARVVNGSEKQMLLLGGTVDTNGWSPVGGTGFSWSPGSTGQGELTFYPDTFNYPPTVLVTCQANVVAPAIIPVAVVDQESLTDNKAKIQCYEMADTNQGAPMNCRFSFIAFGARLAGQKAKRAKNRLRPVTKKEAAKSKAKSKK